MIVWPKVFAYIVVLIFLLSINFFLYIQKLFESEEQVKELSVEKHDTVTKLNERDDEIKQLHKVIVFFYLLLSLIPC